MLKKYTHFLIISERFATSFSYLKLFPLGQHLGEQRLHLALNIVQFFKRGFFMCQVLDTFFPPLTTIRSVLELHCIFYCTFHHHFCLPS